MPGLVVIKLGMELVAEAVARATGAGAGGIAALRHEVLDDAVEDRAVIEAFAGQEHEVVDGLRGLVGEETE